MGEVAAILIVARLVAGEQRTHQVVGCTCRSVRAVHQVGGECVK